MLTDRDLQAISRHLGVVVRARREELGLSQEQLAHRTGLAQRRIWEIERARTSPQLTTWLRLANGLETQLGALVSTAETQAARETR